MKLPSFKFEPKEKDWTVDEEIKSVLNAMEREGLDKDSEEDYKRYLEYLERLTDIKQKQKLVVHPDALVGAAATFLGILVIMSYERGHVIATKAFNLLPKIRI